jgi:predicted transcriptional regulator
MSVGPDPEALSGDDLLRIGTGIVAAYVSRNAVPADDLPDVIRTVHTTLEGLARGAAPLASPSAAAYSTTSSSAWKTARS